MVRDRLVCGVNNDHIQRRLLLETELDLKKTLELALGMETAAKNVRELQGTRRAAEPQLQKDVCKLQREVMNNCYRCGSKTTSPPSAHSGPPSVTTVAKLAI